MLCNSLYELALSLPQDLKCYNDGGKTHFDILHITENEYCKTVPIKEIISGIVGCFAVIAIVFLIIGIYLQKVCSKGHCFLL